MTKPATRLLLALLAVPFFLIAAPSEAETEPLGIWYSTYRDTWLAMEGEKDEKTGEDLRRHRNY